MLAVGICGPSMASMGQKEAAEKATTGRTSLSGKDMGAPTPSELRLDFLS